MPEQNLVNGRYLVKSTLGSGGMGSVLLAEDQAREGTRVALKMVPREGASVEKSLIDALVQEFETLSRLRHPNLPGVHDFGRIEGSPGVFLSMDYVQGEDLNAASKSLSPEETLSVVAQVCRALEFIHTRGLIHRDVKPQNILVSGAGAGEPLAVLVDFGLASQASDKSRMKGTVQFVPPEILMGGRLDRRADLYALGVLIYKLCTGRCPYEGPSQEVLKGHLEGVPARPSMVLAPGVPAPLRPVLNDALSAVILKLLEKDPARRYRTASETLQALNRATGSDHPIETSDTGGAYSASADMVGREKEVKQIDAVLEQLAARLESGPSAKDASLVLVEGEAGTGKTRFILEAKRRTQVAGMQVAVVTCSEDAPAFQPITEALSLLGAPPLEAAGEKATNGDASRRARLRTIDAATTRIASRATDRTMVLLLDDAHAADDGTLAVIETLARNPAMARGLVILLAYRPEEMEGSALQRTLKNLAEIIKAERIPLAPLDRIRTSAMIAGMLGLATAPDELVDLVFKETSGNPLFIEQAIRSLLEDGIISRIGKEFRADVDALTQISFPAGVGEAIRRRLGRMPDGEQRLLEILAVVRRPADTDLIVQAMEEEMPRPEVDSTLADLVRRGILVDEAPGQGGKFVISNARTRDVVYERIDWERRREIHKLVADALNARSERGIPVRYEELARHFIHGAEAEAALPYALEAAQRSRRMGASVEARAFYSSALELLPAGSDARRAEILTAVGIIDREYGRDRDALGALDRAQRAAGKAGRRDLAATAILEKAELHLRGARVDDATREVEKALEILQGVENLSLTARAYSFLASAAVQSGKLEKALDLQHLALDAAEKSGDAYRLAGALNNLGMLQIMMGGKEEGLASLERSVQIRRSVEDRHGEMGALNNIGFHLASWGERDRAREVLEEAVRIGREIGEIPMLCDTLITLGTILLAEGRHDRAITCFEESAALSIRVGHDERASYALDRWGRSCQLVGDTEAAIEKHAEALRKASQASSPTQEFYALGSLALVHAEAGDIPRAREVLKRGAKMGTSSRPPRAHIRFLEAQALVQLEEGAVVEAETSAREFADLAHAEKMPQKEGNAWLILGRIQEARHEPKSALASYKRAVEVARDGAAYEPLWRALSVRARLLEVSGDRASAAAGYSEARQLIEELAARLADPELAKLYRAAPDRQALLSVAQSVDTISISTGSALDALYRMSEIITSTSDLDAMLTRVLDLALEIVRAERGLIILVDDSGERQEVRAARGVEPETIADALEYSHNVVREAAGGKTMVMLDPETEDAFRKYRSVSMFQIKSLACVPMKVQERVLGTVYLDSRREGYLFREEDLEFLQAFANLAGAALEMARLNANLSNENVTLQREVRDLRKAAGDPTRYQELVGKSPRMEAVYDMLDKVSDSNLPVLVTGESGTGKELVARALHFSGARKAKKFFSENVAAIPETLLESELFGHTKGAFTGADKDRKGVFELADGGTLFLDEIGDMSLHLQSKLLRALQDGEVRPLGAKESIRVDVRVITATNKDLSKMIEEGSFREDLYYRINVIGIQMPALRERKEDIPLLVDHFLAKASEASGEAGKRLDISALQLLLRYDWPGNVRELENEILKLTVLSSGDVITQQEISSNRELFEKLTRIAGKADEFTTLSEMERRQIEKALVAAGGNRAKAAQLLGISRATIYRKLREHGISV